MTSLSNEEHEQRANEWRRWLKALPELKIIQPQHSWNVFQALLASEFAYLTEGIDDMAKAGRKPNATKDAKRSAIMTALKFVSVGASNKGQGGYQEHVQIKGGTMLTFDGIVAAGIRIEGADDISANPHAGKLMAALEKCGPEFAVTQLDNNRISIKSGKLRYIVPCLPDDVMSPVFPDPYAGRCTPMAIAAMITAGKLVSDNATTVVEAAVLVEGYSVLSTDRKTMIQIMFDCEFPKLTIPKAFVHALAKIGDKAPVSFGFSERSLTIYFEDAFIRTQLYSEGYPDNAAKMLPANFDGFMKMPAEVWVGLEKLLPFTTETDDIFLTKTGLATSLDEGTAATYEIEGMLEVARLSAKALKFIQEHCAISHLIDDKKNKVHLFQFFNETKMLRGALALKRMENDEVFNEAAVQIETVQQAWTAGNGEPSAPSPGIADAYAGVMNNPGPPVSYGTGPLIETTAVPDPIPSEFHMSNEDAQALYANGHLRLDGSNWYIGSAMVCVGEISTMGFQYWLEKAFPANVVARLNQMSPDIDNDPSIDEDETPAAPASGGWQTS